MPYPEPGLRLRNGRSRGVHGLCTAALSALSIAVLLPAASFAIAGTTWQPAKSPNVASAYVADPPVLPVQVGLEEFAARPAGAASGRNSERWRSEGVFLIDASSWSERSRAMVDDALAMLPANVRGQLGNSSFGPIYVSVNRDGRTMSGQQPYHRAANFFSTNEGRNEVVLFPDQTSRTALHELGHAYNLRHVPAGSYAQVYLDDEMQSFLTAAGWRVLTPASELRSLRDHVAVEVVYDGVPVWSRLSREDPLEDFANSFALYFTAPLELKALSTERYTWFQDRFATPN